MSTKRKTRKGQAMASGSVLVPPPVSGFAGNDRTNDAAPLVATKLLGNQVWAFDLSGIPVGMAKTLPIAVSLGTRAYPVRGTERLHTEKFAATVTPGMATEDFREFFLAKGNDCNGTLQLKRRADGWVASMAKDARPYVLTKEAVEAGAMPPQGASALPPSLESVIPYAFRYWTMEGAQAKAARDALASTSLFSEGLVKMVDGEHRLCVSRMFLWEPDDAELSKTEFALPDPGPTLPGYAFKCERCPAPAERALVFLSVGKSTEHELVCGACCTKALVSSTESLTVTKAVSIEDAFASMPADTIIGKTVRVTADTGENAIGKVLAEAEGNCLVLFEGGERLLCARHRCSDPSDTVTKGLLPVSLRAKAVEPPHGKPYRGVNADVPRPARDAPDHPAGDGDTLTKFLSEEHTVRFAKAKEADPKVVAEERFVYGIVLEPETVDAQQDIYSGAEIRTAAHEYMEKFRTIGLMHKGAINDKVKILESFIAPADFEVDGAPVKAGTWVMGVKVTDDDLWAAVKSGDITGFSIGGSAVRKPNTATTQAA